MSEQMAEAFVKNDIHLILFNVLYRDDKAELSLSVSLTTSTLPTSTPNNDTTDTAIEDKDCELSCPKSSAVESPKSYVVSL